MARRAGFAPGHDRTARSVSQAPAAGRVGPFDAVVIDPPRAGAEAQIGQIAASRLSRVAMVSCNPVTFARDARALVDAGFSMGPITVVDQFRWSTHVELVAAFSRG